MENIAYVQTTGIANRYMYSGKELNTDLGIEWSDFDARWYDAAVGRWWSVDALAEKNVNWTSYRYCFNNPLRFIDPDGRNEEDAKGDNGGWITDKKGNLYYDKDVRSKKDMRAKYGKKSGLTFQGDQIVAKDSKGNRYFGDKDGSLCHMTSKDAEVSANQNSSGVATFQVGVSATGCVGVGAQGGFDAVWILKGKDASVFPYIVGNAAAGIGYNADVDAHAGFGFYNGDKNDVTAENILVTKESGKGITVSASASAIAEVGVNYSYSEATKKTGYHAVTLSVGASASPGINGYAARYVSTNFGRLDVAVVNAVKKVMQ